MNVIEFPLPTISDEDYEYLVSESVGKLLAENVDLEIEVACQHSWAVSLQARLEAMQLRRWRYLLSGGFAGSVVTLALDGSIARWLA